MPPIITQCAPAANALAISPEYRIPPSPMTGTPVPSNALATRAIALICGTPTPAMTRVVQIDPGPMPTLTASAPCLTRSSAASAVTMLPPITWISGYFFLILATVSNTPREWPCEVSTTTTSTPASRSADAQAADAVLARVRKLGRLLKILDGDHAFQFMVPVHHQHFFDAMLVQ